MKKIQNHTRNSIEAMRTEIYQLMNETSQINKETSQLIKENSQLIKENAQQDRETSQELKEFFKESHQDLRDSFKESHQDLREFFKESNREVTDSFKKSNQELTAFFENSRQKSDESLEKLHRYLGGIAHSNGEMAEEYFYSAFKADATFANEKFDEIERNMAFKGIGKSKKAEFDLVLLNGKSAALIEVKYNAKPENISIEKIISRVKLFKILAPECEGYDIYLGVAAMSFKEGLETKLHQAGIATIRPVGEKMVVFDQSVKVF